MKITAKQTTTKQVFKKSPEHQIGISARSIEWTRWSRTEVPVKALATGFLLAYESFMKFYKHYKNKPYEFLGTARHSETLEEVVIYKCRYPNDLGPMWVRPKGMFFEEILLDGKMRPRFAKIEFTFESFDKIPVTEMTTFSDWQRDGV